jgi:hypothetical protein
MRRFAFALCLILITFQWTPTLVPVAAQFPACSIAWHDLHHPDQILIEISWSDPCPVDEQACKAQGGYLFGDYPTKDTPWAWVLCAEPEPDPPGLEIGAACTTERGRTATIITNDADGYELRGPDGFYMTTSRSYSNLPEGDHWFSARAFYGADKVSDWVDAVGSHDYSPPITTFNPVGTVGLNGWWRSAVSVALPGTDMGCMGIQATYYTLDGINGNYSGVPFLVTGEGAHSLSFYSTDGGNLEAPQAANLSIDTVPPTLTLTPSRLPDTASGWYRTPMHMTIAFDDVTSGIAFGRYSINSGAAVDYTAPVQFGSDGQWAFDVIVQDRAGWETVDGVVLPVDQTPPTLAIVTNPPANPTTGWWLVRPDITLVATDATSGIAGTGFQWSGGSWTNYAGGSVPLPAEGQHTLQALTQDVAEHTATANMTFNLDLGAPTTQLYVEGTLNEQGWYITPPIAYLVATDGVSGVRETVFVHNDIHSGYTGGRQFGDGFHALSGFSRDHAGHNETPLPTLNIRVDTLPPDVSFYVEGNLQPDGSYAPGVKVTLVTSDLASGVNQRRIRVNGVEQDYATALVFSDVGVYEVVAYASDHLGRVSAPIQQTFYVGMPPVLGAPLTVQTNPTLPTTLPPFNGGGTGNNGTGTLNSAPTTLVFDGQGWVATVQGTVAQIGQALSSAAQAGSAAAQNAFGAFQQFVTNLPVQPAANIAGVRLNTPLTATTSFPYVDPSPNGSLTDESVLTGNSAPVTVNPAAISASLAAVPPVLPAFDTDRLAALVQNAAPISPAELAARFPFPTVNAAPVLPPAPEPDPLTPTQTQQALAALGLLSATTAGVAATLLQSASARRRQNELAAQRVHEQSHRQDQLAAQQVNAAANWAQNQAQQDAAHQIVRIEPTYTAGWRQYLAYQKSLAEQQAAGSDHAEYLAQVGDMIAQMEEHLAGLQGFITPKERERILAQLDALKVAQTSGNAVQVSQLVDGVTTTYEEVAEVGAKRVARYNEEQRRAYVNMMAAGEAADIAEMRQNQRERGQAANQAKVERRRAEAQQAEQRANEVNEQLERMQGYHDRVREQAAFLTARDAATNSEIALRAAQEQARREQAQLAAADGRHHSEIALRAEQ